MLGNWKLLKSLKSKIAGLVVVLLLTASLGMAASTRNEVVRTGPHSVHVYMATVHTKFVPDHFSVKKGDKVTISISNKESDNNKVHGFAISDQDFNLILKPGQTTEIEFTAGEPGTYWYYCTWYCSPKHFEKRGRMVVE